MLTHNGNLLFMTRSLSLCVAFFLIRLFFFVVCVTIVAESWFVFYVAMKKEFRGQVFLIRSGFFIQACCCCCCGGCCFFIDLAIVKIQMNAII